MKPPNTPREAGLLTIQAIQAYGQKWPSSSIAGLLHETHPAVFPSFDQARSRVRYYRGQNGKKNFEKLMKSQHRVYTAPAGDPHCNDIPLPESLAEGENWHTFDVTFNRALILQDLHIPFHDPAVIALAIAEGKRRDVDCVVINGDGADFYGLSTWEKDPTARSFNDEIQMVRLFLEHLRDKFPKARLIYKEGNHEERLWRYLWRACPALYAVKDKRNKSLICLASLIDAESYGIEVVADKRPILAGPHLHILHGHEFPSRIDKSVNTARGLFLRARCNAFCGHTHASSSHISNGLANRISCWSGGCSCDLHPKYLPINDWNHGFAMMELNRKQWQLENLKVINGQVVSA